MRTIYKYPLAIIPEQVIRLPKGAEILAVHFQGDIFKNLQLWALIESSEVETESFTIVLCGTGTPANYSKAAYITTLQQSACVWHIFAYRK